MQCVKECVGLSIYRIYHLNNSGFALVWPKLIERNDQKADKVL